MSGPARSSTPGVTPAQLADEAASRNSQVGALNDALQDEIDARSALDTRVGTLESDSGGTGLPSGGSSGQGLVKQSGTDGDAAWVDIATQTELNAVAAAAQPVDSDLTAIAALSTTSFGRALLALADAPAGRTALGLGTASTQATGAFDAAGAATTAVAAHEADTTSVHGIADTAGVPMALTWDGSSNYVPASLRTDTTRPRRFIGPTNPATIGSITFTANDTWVYTGSIAVRREFGRNVKDFGAVGDGSGALLSSRYGSLGAAQAVYPFATSLSQTLDWAGIQAAMSSGGDFGVEVFVPTGDYKIFNNRFDLPPILSMRAEGKGRRTIDRAAANTLAVSLDFTGFNLNDFSSGAFSHDTGVTGGVTALSMRGFDILGPLEINVSTDNHCFRLQSSSDCMFEDLRISGFSRAFHLVNCAHIDMLRCNILRQKTAGVSFSEGTSFVSMRRMHFANSFYTTTSGVRSGYLVFAATGAEMSFITLEEFLGDEQGQNGMWLDNCNNVLLKQGVAYCSTAQADPNPETFCVRVSADARKATLRDMHIEPYWGDANNRTNSLRIESGAADTLLDRVTTTTKGTQASGDVYTNSGTNTITRDCVLDGTSPSASGQV